MAESGGIVNIIFNVCELYQHNPKSWCGAVGAMYVTVTVCNSIYICIQGVAFGIY